MRRPIAHLTGAAAVLAVLVAVSLTLAPGALSPGGLPPAPSFATASFSAQPGASGPPPSAPPSQPVEGGGGTAQPNELAPVSADKSAALQAAVDRARLAFGLTSVAVGISADAQLGWSGAAGPPREGSSEALSGTTPFAIASVTKTFTAAIVLQLVDEGRVELDKEVNDYLPELAIARGVTVRQLLSHTSGIADLLAPMRTRLNAEPARIWQPAEVLALLGPSTFPPGTSWGYSNTNYVIAGLLVENVTGHPFVEELERRITGPLRLRGTGPPERGVLPELLGASWSSAFWTSAMLDSNAANLVRWGDALYGGSILSGESLAQMLDFNEHGYGLGAEQYGFGGLTGYGHSGLLRGFTTLLVRLPKAHLTVALLATGHLFDVGDLLTYSAPGSPSILQLAGQLRPS